MPSNAIDSNSSRSAYDLIYSSTPPKASGPSLPVATSQSGPHLLPEASDFDQHPPEKLVANIERAPSASDCDRTNLVDLWLSSLSFKLKSALGVLQV